jgi:hypothetical protein
VRPYHFVSLATIAALMGCGGSDFPPTFPVTGAVTYNSKPLDGATVTLVPKDAAGRSASGITDSEGKFAVSTYFGPEHSPAGALPGDYAVTVSKSAERVIPEGLDQWQVQQWVTKQGAPKALVPKKYSSPERSGLSATVSSETAPLTLDLQD